MYDCPRQYQIAPSPPFPHFTYYPSTLYNRQMESVDSTLFNKSAIEMEKLMRDASLILTKIVESKEFGKQVMAAAQESNLKEVERLINSSGIHSVVDTSYSPDGLNLKFTSNVENTECCKLTVALRWR
jgi:hypothetical protein